MYQGKRIPGIVYLYIKAKLTHSSIVQRMDIDQMKDFPNFANCSIVKQTIDGRVICFLTKIKSIKKIDLCMASFRKKKLNFNLHIYHDKF
ncbi:hypothetical protein GDO86_002396 [Hymenochirus boettgeri]|uniref:Uncharacterized protein n=1 Tax=Hymenochirus boettgeri TaxID=247094 RepID=A0A8T2KHW1_9PIPI|nr:hypothetical protein GDO86_002396 [Hymenochirus boettgeri]